MVAHSPRKSKSFLVHVDCRDWLYFHSFTASGFEKPSAIQQRAIVPLVKGRDLIAQSQSGTGKTAVFSIGVLQSLDLSTTETQAIGASCLLACQWAFHSLCLSCNRYPSLPVYAPFRVCECVSVYM
jgi:hypothetical protein